MYKRQSQSIVKQFGINPSLDIVYYADSEQDLKQAILDKKIEAGVMIPENFSRDMSLKKSPQAVIFADCSNIITGGGAVGAASSVLGLSLIHISQTCTAGLHTLRIGFIRTAMTRRPP